MLEKMFQKYKYDFQRKKCKWNLNILKMLNFIYNNLNVN